MIDLGKRKYNLILGIIVGLFLAQIAFWEGYAFIGSKYNTLVIDYTKYLKIIAIIIFCITVIIFNSKIFRKINLDKIGVYLILSVLVSVVVTIEGIIILSRIIFFILPNIKEAIENNYFLVMNLSYVMVFISICLFIGTFILLLNIKVRYINYLTKEIKIIKDEGFGRVIEVKGNDELAELCVSINEMSVELARKIENEKKMENTKNELITNISHDLKTPLTSIIGYLDILNKNDITEEEKKQYIEIAYNKSLRLSYLVNELFEYTKLTGNEIQIKKQKINISMLLNQSVGESIINFDSRNMEVELKNPYEEIYCNIDSQLMIRVFENIIRNAEKYSDKDSKFIVNVSIDDENVIMSFNNKCSEIKNEDLENLFEKFYRVDKSRHKEGSGLGLPIVKRIIELHDGEIWAEKIKDNIQFNIKLKRIQF